MDIINNCAIVTYSSKIENVINFNTTDILSKIESLDYRGEDNANDNEALESSINLFNNTDKNGKMILYFSNGLIDISKTYQARKLANDKKVVIVPVIYNNSTLEQFSDTRYTLKFGDINKLKCMQTNIPYTEFNKSDKLVLGDSFNHRVEFYQKPKYYYIKSYMNQSLNVSIKIVKKEMINDYVLMSVSDSDNTNHTIGMNTSLLLSHNETNTANKFEFILGPGCKDCLSSRISFINVISSGLDYSIDVNNCTDCSEGVYVYDKEKSSSFTWLWVLLSLVIFLIIGVVYIIWRNYKKSKIGKEEGSYVSMNL